MQKLDGIDEIVKQLPELREAHKRTKGDDLRFANAIAQIARARNPRQVIRQKYWNETIDFLDRNYPGWRGCPNPEYNSEVRLND